MSSILTFATGSTQTFSPTLRYPFHGYSFCYWRPFICTRHCVVQAMQKILRSWGVGLFLSLPGVLSLVAMDFRPGKAIAIFFITYILYLTLRNRRDEARDTKSGSLIARPELYIAFIYMISLSSDEIAIFSLATIILLHRYEKPRSVLLPVLAMLASVLYFLFVKRFVYVLCF